MSSNHQAKAPGVAQMLQYTSGGHALGFTSGGMYAATGSHALHVDFVSANSVQPQADSPAAVDGKAAALSQVTYADLWPGITLTYTASPDSIYTTTYSLAAGANPQDIRLHYNAPLTLDADGNLGIAFETGTMTESAPIAWQEIDGKRVSVDSSFRVRGQEVTFIPGKYDPRHALTIDPSLTWHTFLGGTLLDEGYAIAVDVKGNVYVTGYSGATWGCSPTACTVRAYTSSNDAFAAKLDSSGGLTWNTFLGAGGYDVGLGIAVDGKGNVYVTGYSDATWVETPVLPHSSGYDAFAAQLDSTGALTWYTFLGGSGSDFGFGIVADGDGNAYVTGNSDATWGSPVRPYTSSGNDAFAAKLDSSGGLTWNTFLGGTGSDYGYGIAVDYKGNVYVAGDSGATWGTPVRAYTISDAFAAKLDLDGNLIWNTFLGGASSDEGKSIAVDGSGNVYVTGISFATWGTPVRAYSASFDGFAAKLDSSGALTWNTFLGTSGDDAALGIAVDGGGNVYVAGYSDATWGSPLRAYTSSYDAFAAKLDSSGALTGNTFLGGTGSDFGRGIAVDGDGNVYVGGRSTITWGSPVRPFTGSGGADAFAAKLVFPISISGNAGVAGATLSYTGGSTVADGSGKYSFTVPYGWSGTVMPSKTDYIFTPYFMAYASVTTDEANQNYSTAPFVVLPPVTGIFPGHGSQACRVPQVGVQLLLTDLMRKAGSFDPSTVMLTLDGTDVTGSAAISQTETYPASEASVLYTPPGDLALGPHQAVFTYPSAGGPVILTWNFTVADIPCPTGGAHSPTPDNESASDFSGIESP